jgi:hypothetical protein
MDCQLPYATLEKSKNKANRAEFHFQFKGKYSISESYLK